MRPTLAASNHTYRETWLAEAADKWRPVFAKLGYPLPESIKFSVAFPSTGMKGNRIGEHWHGSASADGSHHIFIRPDLDDPMQVLGVLTHELCHAAAPKGAKHGPEFRAVAETVGLVGKMIHAMPGPELNGWLSGMLRQLGPLPHVKLNFSGNSKKKPKAEPTRKCVCEQCGYEARVPLRCVEVAGPPLCPDEQCRDEDGLPWQMVEAKKANKDTGE